jgi:hypothetical protein
LYSSLFSSAGRCRGKQRFSARDCRNNLFLYKPYVKVSPYGFTRMGHLAGFSRIDYLTGFYRMSYLAGFYRIGHLAGFYRIGHPAGFYPRVTAVNNLHYRVKIGTIEYSIGYYEGDGGGVKGYPKYGYKRGYRICYMLIALMLAILLYGTLQTLQTSPNRASALKQPTNRPVQQSH